MLNEELLLHSIDLVAAKSLLGCNQEVIWNFIHTFIEDLKQALPVLHEYYMNKDWKNMEKKVHQLYGGAIYCAMPQLAQILRNLETLLREKENISLKSLKVIYKKLLKEIQKIQDEVKDLSLF